MKRTQPRAAGAKRLTCVQPRKSKPPTLKLTAAEWETLSMGLAADLETAMHMLKHVAESCDQLRSQLKLNAAARVAKLERRR